MPILPSQEDLASPTLAPPPRAEPRAEPRVEPRVEPPALPPRVAALVWRGGLWGQASVQTWPSGWAALDRELVGGGWPSQALSEILCAPFASLEWRLLAPALKHMVAQGKSVIVVGPPSQPHLPGLAHEGLNAQQLIWIQAQTCAERLWVTEQLIVSSAAGAVLTWLPQAPAAQLRRLQALAAHSTAAVFLFRPDSARELTSPAPLRVLASCGPDWELRVQVFKRRGPPHEGWLQLPSMPGGLRRVLTPALHSVSALLLHRQHHHAVGRPLTARPPQRRTPAY